MGPPFLYLGWDRTLALGWCFLLKLQGKATVQLELKSTALALPDVSTSVFKGNNS